MKYFCTKHCTCALLLIFVNVVLKCIVRHIEFNSVVVSGITYICHETTKTRTNKKRRYVWRLVAVDLNEFSKVTTMGEGEGGLSNCIYCLKGFLAPFIYLLY